MLPNIEYLTHTHTHQIIGLYYAMNWIVFLT